MIDANMETGGPYRNRDYAMGSMHQETPKTAQRGLPRRSLSGTLAAVALAAVLVFAGCEGENLFSGGPAGGLGQGPPRVGRIDAPFSVPEGGRLDIRVRAIAPAGMERVDVRFRRGANDDQEFLISGNRTDSVTVDAAINVPPTVLDSVIIVEAFVTDRLGRVSDVVSAIVRVESRSLPVVSATVTPSGSASIGDTLRVSVSARDVFGLQAIGWAIVNEAGDTVHGPRYSPVSGVLRDTVFAIALPPSLRTGNVTVIGLAINNQELRGVSSPLALNLVDALPPLVEILSPRDGESFPLGDSLLVRVHVADSGGIKAVRLRAIAIRGDSLANSVVVPRYVERAIPFPQPPSTRLPTDTILQRFLQPTPDTTSEPIFIIASAEDASGNVREDTVRVTDGPRVQILSPATGTTVGINSTLLVHLSASDRTSTLDSMVLVVGGTQQQQFRLPNLNRGAVDTTVAVPIGAATGPLTLRASVWSRSGALGNTPLFNLTIGTQATADTTKPRVLRIVSTPDRIELGDSIQITVRATDGAGGGVRRMGLVITATSDSAALPTGTIFRTTQTFDPPLSGTPERIFRVALSELYSVTQANYPRRIALHVHAFAIDAVGNCGASVGETLTALACDTVASGGVNFHSAAGQAATPLHVTAVGGRSVTLPGGGRIADALVDAVRRRVYLSNISNNRIDIFNLGADTFDVTGPRPGACAGAPSGQASCRGVVGAAPWGMFFNNRGDSLFVANSGGTNISILPLDGQHYMREHVDRRVLIPNVILWEIGQSLTETGIQYTNSWYDFSDRPQYVAQHESGVLIYSTLPTPSARDGTIRAADTDPDPNASDDLPESYILHTGDAVRPAENRWAIANLDSLVVVRSGTGTDRVVLYDHLPGYYDQPGRPGRPALVSDTLEFWAAVADLKGQGSDILVYPGSWDLTAFALADTTFVAASANRRRIAIGEGARSPGRIFMCCEIMGSPLRVGLSSKIPVTDLLNNASERALGLALNQDGSYGVVRGAQAAYYFTPDLRLQGEFRQGVPGGTGGAALHPHHARALETGDAALSFVATPNRTIKIIDSTHFYQRGELHIRDNVVGPVRAVLPSSQENAGRSSSDPNYIVVKLIAVTANDHVVIIDVHRKDLGG